MLRVFINFGLFMFLLLFSFNMEAQSGSFKRKQAKPSFFVPEKELKEKQEVLPLQFRAALPPSEITVEKNEGRSIKKTAYNDDAFDVNRYTYYSGNERVSEYKKVYDEYLKDLKHLKKYSELPVNIEKERDLGKMNSENVFRIK